MNIQRAELDIKYHCDEFLESITSLNELYTDYHTKELETANLLSKFNTDKKNLCTIKSWYSILGLLENNYLKYLFPDLLSKDKDIYTLTILEINQEKLNKNYENFQNKLTFPVRSWKLTNNITLDSKIIFKSDCINVRSLFDIIEGLSMNYIQFVDKKEFNSQYEFRK